MCDQPPTWSFHVDTLRGNPEKDSATKGEEITINDYAEPVLWTSTSGATESSDLPDIFRVLSDINFQEPSSPLIANTKYDTLPTKINLGAVEHGKPSTGTRKRKVKELELHKRSNEGNEQISTESKKGEKKAKKSRSTETHNMSERRRRGRIKEKNKSLQKLIPNSDKRDCASILDEAIQYLKMLKNQAAQIQMMSLSMGSVYCNPYMSATGIPHMPVAQYYPYGTFRPGMRLVSLVPMHSPALGPSEVLPLVQGPTEFCTSLPTSRTRTLPALRPTDTAMLTSHLDDHSKEGPPFRELEEDACGSQEASTSGQIISKPNPGSIVHATHIVPPAPGKPDTNLYIPLDLPYSL